MGTREHRMGKVSAADFLPLTLRTWLGISGEAFSFSPPLFSRR